MESDKNWQFTNTLKDPAFAVADGLSRVGYTKWGVYLYNIEILNCVLFYNNHWCEVLVFFTV